MDPSDIIELEGRHNVGFGMHIRWKTMRVNSEQRWVAYKETVAESLDKALELFATKKVDSSLHLDLNRNPSPLVASSPPPLKRDEIVDPLLTQEVRPTLSPFTNNQDEALQEENDMHESIDNDDSDDSIEIFPFDECDACYSYGHDANTDDAYDAELAIVPYVENKIITIAPTLDSSLNEKHDCNDVIINSINVNCANNM